MTIQNWYDNITGYGNREAAHPILRIARNVFSGALWFGFFSAVFYSVYRLFMHFAFMIWSYPEALDRRFPFGILAFMMAFFVTGFTFHKYVDYSLEREKWLSRRAR